MLQNMFPCVLCLLRDFLTRLWWFHSIDSHIKLSTCSYASVPPKMDALHTNWYYYYYYRVHVDVDIVFGHRRKPIGQHILVVMPFDGRPFACRAIDVSMTCSHPLFRAFKYLISIICIFSITFICDSNQWFIGIYQSIKCFDFRIWRQFIFKFIWFFCACEWANWMHVSVRCIVRLANCWLIWGVFFLLK